MKEEQPQQRLPTRPAWTGQLYDGASDMSLENWHTRLHKHFATLAGQRAAHGRAVFALEHGLQDNEIQALEADVRESLKVRSPSEAFWLPWVVYATEVGYKYEGEEYWQTFERTTPGWTTCQAKPREWLRDRFVGFHMTYKGLRPIGRWASWFSIIAWPIQHAILPGYLQYHLAKLLYELRFHFTARLLSDPYSLGHFRASALLFWTPFPPGSFLALRQTFSWCYMPSTDRLRSAPATAGILAPRGNDVTNPVNTGIYARPAEIFLV